jgi:hypothetical protein
MSNSNHRIICTDCGRDQPVVEDAISNPAIKPPEPTSATPNPRSTARAHLHATRENDACTERGSINHIDVVCRGSPICGIHDKTEFHDPYPKCPGDHQWVGCESDGA